MLVQFLPQDIAQVLGVPEQDTPIPLIVFQLGYGTNQEGRGLQSLLHMLIARYCGKSWFNPNVVENGKMKLWVPFNSQGNERFH